MTSSLRWISAALAVAVAGGPLPAEALGPAPEPAASAAAEPGAGVEGRGDGARTPAEAAAAAVEAGPAPEAVESRRASAAPGESRAPRRRRARRAARDQERAAWTLDRVRARYSRPGGRPRWDECAEGVRAACVRSRPARLLLGALGLLGAGAGLTALLVLGERMSGRDPAGLMVGAGGIALGGAILGAGIGRAMGEGPTAPDRIRISTLSSSLTWGRRAVLEERHPPTMDLQAAPTFALPADHGRVRILGSVGGLLGADEQLDPRPQLADTGTVALREKRLELGLAADVALYLPYPLLSPRRSRFLGRAELRWRPEVQVRRHRFDKEGGRRRVQRTMFLPLTVGMRWRISGLQRFTFYIGPRFDFVTGDDPDSGMGPPLVSPGNAATGPIYGEAWYHFDVPFSQLVARRGHRSRVEVNGLLTVGYVHSRFDGRGFNISGAIGFTGPLMASWALRVRPRGAKWALQGEIGTWIGNGAAPFLRLGVVLPDVPPLERSRSRAARRGRP